MAAEQPDLVANFAPDMKPVIVEGVPVNQYGGVKTLELTVKQAKRLRDSLNIVLDELVGTVFDRDDR